MEKNDNFEGISNFLRFMLEATEGLSKESKEKVLSADTWRKASECKSSEDFLRFIKSMDLAELKYKKFGEAISENLDDIREIMDDFLKSGRFLH